MALCVGLCSVVSALVDQVLMCYLQARWEEVTTWSDQRGHKIEAALSELRANAAMLDQLMGWLTAAEANLSAQAHEILPDNLPIIEQLFQDHQVCAVRIIVVVFSDVICSVTDHWMSCCRLHIQLSPKLSLTKYYLSVRHTWKFVLKELCNTLLIAHGVVDFWATS